MFNPLTLKSKLIAALAILLVGFFLGWKVHGWKYASDNSASIAKTEKIAEKSIAKIDAVVETKTDDLAKTKIIYRTIREQINEKDDNRICFADADALSMWNSAIAGKDTPRQEPSRAPTTANATENTTIVATVKQVLTNASENFQTCNENNIKHNALIDAVTVYKDKMCVCSE